MTTTTFIAPLASPVKVSRHATPVCGSRGNELAVGRRAFFSGDVRVVAPTALSWVVSRASAAASGDTVVSATRPAVEKTKVVWGYTPDIGPEHWGYLQEDWAIMKDGEMQSPIAVSFDTAVPATPMDKRPVLSVDRNARWVVQRKDVLPQVATKWLVVEPVPSAPALPGVKPQHAGLITVPGAGRYRLKSAHFHTDGSEHVIDGKRSQMECHLVFILDEADPNAGVVPPYTVVGVLIDKEKETSPWIDSLLRNVVRPYNSDVDAAGCEVNFDLEAVMPNFNYANVYTYDGSLTTPPGTEGLYWILMNERARVSAKDCALLENFQGGPNTRPLMPDNGRKVINYPTQAPTGRIGA